MGTSTSAAQFAGKIQKAATVTQRRQRETVDMGALTAKEIIIAEAGARGIQPTSKIAGGRWGVGYDVKGFNNPTALVKVRGPFHLVDSPTKPHKITPRRRGRKASGKKAVAYGGEAFRSVNHPGTKGKESFPAAKKKAAIVVPKVMARSIVSGWRSAIR